MAKGLLFGKGRDGESMEWNLGAGHTNRGLGMRWDADGGWTSVCILAPGLHMLTAGPDVGYLETSLSLFFSFALNILMYLVLFLFPPSKCQSLSKVSLYTT